MRLTGTLVEWKDDRGFGFIESEGTGRRVFCHISAFEVRVRRPMAGDRVTYDIANGKDGRESASRVRPVGLENAQYQPSARVSNRKGGRSAAYHGEAASKSSIAIILTVIIGFFVGIAILVVIGRIPLFVPLAYLGMSGLTMLTYMFDKRAAMNDDQRTPEATLLFLGLLCGWPGGWMSQVIFRHKSRKLSFLVPFWICTVINLAALAAYAFPELR